MVVNRKEEGKREKGREEGGDRVNETDMAWSCIKVSGGDILIVDTCVQWKRHGEVGTRVEINNLRHFERDKVLFICLYANAL